MVVTAKQFQSVFDVVKKWHDQAFRDRLVNGQFALVDTEDYKRLDVLGLYRGVQAIMYCFDIELGRVDEALQEELRRQRDRDTTRKDLVSVKARKRMKKARQIIDRRTFEITEAVQEDMIKQVQADGVPDYHEAKKIANKIWTDRGFTMELYLTADGRTGTQAEFVKGWLERGVSWGDALRCLDQLVRTATQVVGSEGRNEKRELQPTFREAAMKRLKESAARTLTARGASRAEAGGDSG